MAEITRKFFMVDVPCTVVDRYHVFAESEEEARAKMASGEMTEQTRQQFGDYVLVGPTDAEPETHWDRAVIVNPARLTADS